MMPRTTYLRGAVAAIFGAVLLSGCGPTMGDMPLPGTGVSGDTIRLVADFDEALNLSQGAIVKVNGVDAGRVQDVTVQDFKAKAEMLVQTAATVREGATARLRYNTPLGELFVDITNPVTGTPLGDDAVLTDKFTSTAPTVEDSLASASLLINGGGLSQLQTVTEEINQILGGREDTVRDLLAQSNIFLSQANATTADIGHTLDALNAVSKILGAREETIKRALVEIRPASEVLRKNTAGLTRLLQSLQKFSGSANSVVNATRTQLLHLIRESAPVLAEFNKNGYRFGPSLHDLTELADALDGVVETDYLNLGVILPLDSTALGGGGGGDGGGGDGGGGIPGLPGLPLPDIPLPTIPGLPLPDLPGLPLLRTSAYQGLTLQELLGGQS
jgi:phospholipid/cholesterol/gamma-HCH transport system substrate-binding protein